jgi:hypothetical protein
MWVEWTLNGQDVTVRHAGEFALQQNCGTWLAAVVPAHQSDTVCPILYEGLESEHCH